jgi:hypothetical protein
LAAQLLSLLLLLPQLAFKRWLTHALMLKAQGSIASSTQAPTQCFWV